MTELSVNRRMCPSRAWRQAPFPTVMAELCVVVIVVVVVVVVLSCLYQFARLRTLSSSFLMCFGSVLMISPSGAIHSVSCISMSSPRVEDVLLAERRLRSQ